MNAQLSMWRRMRGSADIASCRQVTHLLQSYLDGQLDPGMARRLNRHVEACRRCGLEAIAYKRIKEAVSRRYPVIADPAAVRRLEEFAGQLTDRE